MLNIVGSRLFLAPRKPSLKRSRWKPAASFNDDMYCHEEPLAAVHQSGKVHNFTKSKKVSFNLDEPPPVDMKFSQENLRDTLIFSYFKNRFDSDHIVANFHRQVTRRPSNDFMSWQEARGITRAQRVMLIKWLEDIGRKLNLSTEIILLSVGYFERCLSCERMHEWYYGKMLCLTCMITACKVYGSRHDLEDQAKTLYEATFHGFTKKELVTMESHVCNWLNFDFIQPTTMTFVIFYLEELRILTKESYSLCSFIAELFAIEYDSHKYLHSTIAEVIVKIAVKSIDLKCEDYKFRQSFFENQISMECLDDVRRSLLRENRRSFVEHSMGKSSPKFDFENI